MIRRDASRSSKCSRGLRKLLNSDTNLVCFGNIPCFSRHDVNTYEIKKANCHKVGAPFQYADSFFASLAAVKSMIHIPYRNLMGMILEVLNDEKVPHYTTIYRRIQSLDVQINDGTVTVTGSKGAAIRFAVDSTGLKQHNRGEWIWQKWKVRRGFVKMHILVDVDTKKILAVRVTDDRTGDSLMFIPLFDDALENCVHPAPESGHADSPTRCSAYGDGVAVVSVGGSSFDRFRRFLDIFEIPFVIMADNDAENRFDPKEMLKMSLESFPQAEGWASKKVCLLKKDLEGLLSDLEPKMYGEAEYKYRTKPERAYHFVRQFFAEESSGDSRNVVLLKCLKEWIMKDVI